MSQRRLVRWLVVLEYFLLAQCLSTTFADDPDLPGIAELHQKDAVAYSMYLDSGREKPLELQLDPIFKWQNLTNQGGQLGAIYIWTRQGRPEVIGTMFSQREKGMRNVIHEFHTLAEGRLTIVCPPENARAWQPKGTLPMIALDKTPIVAETATRRMSQMRALAREFTAFTQSEEERVELRLAPQPLVRFQPTRDDVLDGAIFAFLSSAAGTDPEVLLMIEARKAAADSRAMTWHVGIVRFTERDLVVLRQETELFSSISNPKLKVKIEDGYQWCHNPDDTYFVFHAKFVPELVPSTSKP